MAPLLGPPPASEIARRFSEWNAERDAIKSQYESDEEREYSLFNEAEKALKASIDQEELAVTGSQAVHPSIRQFFEDKRLSQVNTLRQVYEAKRAERKQSLEQRLLEHIEACSAFLGLAGGATVEPVSVSFPCAGWAIAGLGTDSLAILGREREPSRAGKAGRASQAG